MTPLPELFYIIVNISSLLTVQLLSALSDSATKVISAAPHSQKHMASLRQKKFFV